MSRAFRRYEIFVPLQFNDGSEVPDELIGQTLLELRARFGAVSSELIAISGQWEHHGVVYHDQLLRTWVDVPDLVANRRYVTRLKSALKKRFKQIDLWIVTFPIEVL